MRTINSFILLCVFCLFCQPTLAQRRVRLADLPPFERAVVVVKYFEGMHSWKNYPYVGYGHQLQPGEHFTADMTERQADSLLRADLWKCFEHFKGMVRMPCCSASLPIMRAWGDCLVMESTPSVDYYER